MTKIDVPDVTSGPDWKAIAISALFVLQVIVGLGVNHLTQTMDDLEITANQNKERLARLESTAQMPNAQVLKEVQVISERLARIEARLDGIELRQPRRP